MHRSPLPTTLFALSLACLGLSGCFLLGGDGGIVSFPVRYQLDEQTVEGNLLGGLLGALLPAAISLDIDLEAETRARDTGPAQHVFLTDLTFRITPTADADGSDDFDFLDSIEIFVESRQSGSTLPRQRIAHRDPVPRGARSISLMIDDVDLIEYVNEGALLTATASGRQPSNDVTFDGQLDLVVEVL